MTGYIRASETLQTCISLPNKHTNKKHKSGEWLRKERTEVGGDTGRQRTKRANQHSHVNGEKKPRNRRQGCDTALAWEGRVEGGGGSGGGEGTLREGGRRRVEGHGARAEPLPAAAARLPVAILSYSVHTRRRCSQVLSAQKMEILT